jgi:hypothetical protein
MSQSFPHSWLMTGFVTRLTWQVPLVEQELLTFIPQFLVGFVLLVLCVCFVDGCLSFFFWPLCCLFLFDLQILITPLVSFGHCVVCSCLIFRFWLLLWYLLAIVLSFLVWFSDSDYSFGIFWPLCCLFLFDFQILITPLVSPFRLFFRKEVIILLSVWKGCSSHFGFSNKLRMFWWLR